MLKAASCFFYDENYWTLIECDVARNGASLFGDPDGLKEPSPPDPAAAVHHLDEHFFVEDKTNISFSIIVNRGGVLLNFQNAEKIGAGLS